MTGTVAGAVATNGTPFVSITVGDQGAVFLSLEVARDLAGNIAREADAAEAMSLRLNVHVDGKDGP